MHKVLNTSLLFAATGLSMAASAAPLHLNSSQAEALVSTLVEFYQVPVAADGQYARTLTVDAIQCRWDRNSSALATCNLVVKGTTVAAPQTFGVAPGATLFQILADNNAARDDAQIPGVLLAEASNVNCQWSGHSGPDYECDLAPVTGNAPSFSPVTLNVSGALALNVANTLKNNGVRDTASRQYTSSVHADTVNCTVIFNLEYRTPSCVLNIGSQTLNVTNQDDAATLYRLVAESGGALYDAAHSAYVGAASNVTCLNTNTHEDTPTTCTFTVAARHQVITHPHGVDLTSDQSKSLNQSLNALHVPSETAYGRTFINGVTLACSNPSTTSDQVDQLHCALTANKQALPVADVWNVYNSYNLTLGNYGSRLDPSTLAGTQSYTSFIYCTGDSSAMDCGATSYVAFPL